MGTQLEIQLAGIGTLTDFIRKGDQEVEPVMKDLRITPTYSPEGRLSLPPAQFQELAKAGIQIPTLRQIIAIYSQPRGRDFLTETSEGKNELIEEVLNGMVDANGIVKGTRETNETYDLNSLRNNPIVSITDSDYPNRGLHYLTYMISEDLGRKIMVLVSDAMDNSYDSDFGPIYHCARRFSPA